MEISEIVRRFVLSSFEYGGRVFVIAPARHLLFRRATYLPYTWGETPWQALYDLARFSEQVNVVTTRPKDEKELQLIYNLAEYARPPRSAPLYLHLASGDVPVLLVNEREAFDGTRLTRAPEEVEGLRKAAEDVISRAKEVGILEYSDIRYEYCGSRFRYYDARCL
jgi:hypothetical protein